LTNSIHTGLAGALPPGQLPTIKLGSLEVFRLILGSNLFFGFAHDNPQASAEEMKDYYTDRQVMTVLDAAVDRGISAVWMPCYDEIAENTALTCQLSATEAA